MKHGCLEHNPAWLLTGVRGRTCLFPGVLDGSKPCAVPWRYSRTAKPSPLVSATWWALMMIKPSTVVTHSHTAQQETWLPCIGTHSHIFWMALLSCFRVSSS